MNPPFHTGLRLGILGGGQLAKMLVEAAQAMGLSPKVLAPEWNDPAAKISGNVSRGELSDVPALRAFLRGVDIALFESEFVPCESLRAAARGLAVQFHPSLDCMDHLQDKLRQKHLLAGQGIATARFVEYRPEEGLVPWIERVIEEFERRVVFKWSTLGYDGKGLYVLPAGEPDLQAVVAFCEQPLKRGIGIYAEARIDFEQELAMVGCRKPDGAFAGYPLVISTQADGICRSVLGPATSFGVSETLERQAAGILRRIGEAADVTGTYAVEFFLDPMEGLLVNEIAPRVHNTGHYTQDAALTSQFENHLRAVLQLPLGCTRAPMPFMMLNLLGPEGVQRCGKVLPLPVVDLRLHLHWYGKEEVREGRKLGHINGCADTPEETGGLLHEARECEERWIEELRAFNS